MISRQKKTLMILINHLPEMRVNGVVTQQHFQLKTFYTFWPFIYLTTPFWGSENAKFWKQASESKIWKRYRYHLCVKMVTSYACVLCVQSTGTVCAQVSSVSLLSKLLYVCELFQKRKGKTCQFLVVIVMWMYPVSSVGVWRSGRYLYR